VAAWFYAAYALLSLNSSLGVQSSSHTPGVLGDEETSLVPKMPLPHICPIQLEEPALLEQPSFETLSGVPIETE
jgi:hypothetical protein